MPKTPRDEDLCCVDAEWAIEAFFDRAMAGGTPDAGRFAIAVSLALLARSLTDVVAEAERQSAAQKPGAAHE